MPDCPPKSTNRLAPEACKPSARAALAPPAVPLLRFTTVRPAARRGQQPVAAAGGARMGDAIGVGTLPKGRRSSSRRAPAARHDDSSGPMKAYPHG